MGEIAEGLINGDFDFITGEYIGEGWGYPRTHYRPKRDINKPYLFSKSESKRGVLNYLDKKGIHPNKRQMIIFKFVKIIGAEYEGKGKLMKACLSIQKHFLTFKNYIKQYMANNPTFAATLIKDNSKVIVYKLRTGTPTADHIWCNLADCKTTYTADELKNFKQND